MSDDDPDGPDPLRVILAGIEQRAAHPAYRGQARRGIGMKMVDVTPDAEQPTYRIRCLAADCGELFEVGAPEIADHHQTHRGGTDHAERGCTTGGTP